MCTWPTIYSTQGCPGTRRAINSVSSATYAARYPATTSPCHHGHGPVASAIVHRPSTQRLPALQTSHKATSTPHTTSQAATKVPTKAPITPIFTTTAELAATSCSVTTWLQHLRDGLRLGHLGHVPLLHRLQLLVSAIGQQPLGLEHAPGRLSLSRYLGGRRAVRFEQGQPCWEAYCVLHSIRHRVHLHRTVLLPHRILCVRVPFVGGADRAARAQRPMHHGTWAVQLQPRCPIRNLRRQQLHH